MSDEPAMLILAQGSPAVGVSQMAWRISPAMLSKLHDFIRNTLGEPSEMFTPPETAHLAEAILANSVYLDGGGR